MDNVVFPCCWVLEFLLIYESNWRVLVFRVTEFYIEQWLVLPCAVTYTWGKRTINIDARILTIIQLRFVIEWGAYWNVGYIIIGCIFQRIKIILEQRNNINNIFSKQYNIRIKVFDSWPRNSCIVIAFICLVNNVDSIAGSEINSSL